MKQGSRGGYCCFTTRLLYIIVQSVDDKVTFVGGFNQMNRFGYF